MEAANVLARVLKKYQECKTYSDCGAVDFHDVDENLENLEFKTSFIRPDYLSFEWQDYGPRRGKSQEFSQLWSKSEKTKVKLRWGLQEMESLQLALAGATGCSAGAASIIPSLLLPESNSKGIEHLSELELDEEELDATECFVLRGTLAKYRDHTIWISKTDFGIKRLRHDRSWTAAESREEYEALQANKALLELLQKEGLKYPSEQEKFSGRRFVSDYRFKRVCFDEDVAEVTEPV